MKWYIIGILLINTSLIKAQIIATYAGCVSMTCTGIDDQRPATAANLDDPAVGAFDRYGNYYFAEGLGKRVRKVSITDTITTVAGNGTTGATGDGGPATDCTFSAPTSVKLDTFGNLYIADGAGSRIRKVDVATGIISTIVGNGTGAFLGENVPATAAEVFGPQDICFDKYGNLYIADAFNYRVRKVNVSGVITTFAGTGGFSGAGSGDGGPATAATFALISGIVADDTGNIYIADNSAARVRRVDTFGIISNYAGNGTGTYIGDGIAATDAQIAPLSLAVDSSGSIIVSDRYNERVYKIDRSGILRCIAGIGGSGTLSGDGGPATAASIDPAGLTFDPCWNLYICDVDNNRVRKVNYNPTCSLHSIDSLESLSNHNVAASGKMSIYPNPVLSVFTITSTSILINITLYMLTGQAVYTRDCHAKQADINITSLSPGLYIVAILDEEGNKTIKKIIKQ